jgi:hypothetical protein
MEIEAIGNRIDQELGSRLATFGTPPDGPLHIAAEARALCDRKLYLNCGDGQPIGVIELEFQTAEMAAGWYCKPMRVTVGLEEIPSEECRRLYRLNAAAAGLLGAARQVIEKHDTEASAADFQRCGCDVCVVLRPALAQAEPK